MAKGKEASMEKDIEVKIEKKLEECCTPSRHKHGNRNGGVASGVYGLAFLGSVIYYFQHATSFGMGVLGFLKALVWPVILVYKIMEFLKM
jgi:hypothetical protein